MTSPRAALLASTTAGVVALALACATVAAPASAAGPGKEVLLTFDADQTERQAGTSGVTVREVTADGGTITSTEGPSGQAARLPAYRSGTAAKAAFSVTDEDGGADDLEPGHSDFSFGADFTLDAVSTGSREDNGNNLVQRGLYNDGAQMKLQVDDRRPSCRLKGRDGGILLTSQHTVAPDEWYRVVCRRVGTKAVLKVVRLSDRTTWTRKAGRSLGAFRYADATPFSSGAKLAGPTSFTGGSVDQFNGAIDRVFLDIS